MFRFLKDLAWNTGKKFQRDSAQQLSASITYYVIFAMFPALIFTVGVVGTLLDESAQRDVVNEVLKLIPLSEGEGRNAVEDSVSAISGTNAQAIGVLGLLGMLWSASSMFTSVRRALNIIYGDPEYHRPWVQQKLVDLGLVLALAVFFTASVAATTVLRVIQLRSEDLAAVGEFSEHLGIVWTAASLGVPFVLSFAAFTVAYTIVPSRNRNLGNAWPGALVAALLFEVAKNLFGLYVQYFKDFDLVFGSLGAVAAFMFWVHLSANIMLLGAEIATVYPVVREKKVKQPRFEGMGVPFRVKAFRSLRSLFVRPPEKPANDNSNPRP